VSGYSAQNRTRTAEAGGPGDIIFVVTGVFVNCDSDSRSGTRADD
jgi:hypothetical protein